jgi:hypothetical protein
MNDGIVRSAAKIRFTGLHSKGGAEFFNETDWFEDVQGAFSTARCPQVRNNGYFCSRIALKTS